MSLRAKIRGPHGILCTRGEKEYASIRQPTVAYDNRLVKREAYDASPGRTPYKSDDAMFLPLAKAMHLRRDVCLWHVADKKAPKWVLKYLLLPKRQNFDEILTFLGKFLRGRVLVVRNRVRFCQKLKRSQNYAVLLNCIGFEADRASPCSHRQAKCRRQAKVRPRRS